MSTTSTQQNENMAAIGSRPIRAHHSSHVHASFLNGIELCCIRCKKLVQEKSCTKTMSDGQVSCTSRLVQVSCTSFLTVCHYHKSQSYLKIKLFGSLKNEEICLNSLMDNGSNGEVWIIYRHRQGITTPQLTSMLSQQHDNSVNFFAINTNLFLPNILNCTHYEPYTLLN